MAQRRIPADAFEYYFSLGPGRSYGAVAKKYGVTKRSVTRAAQRENWPGRLRDIEAKARERTDEKMVAAREAMNERHLQAAKFLQGKALQELRDQPLSKATAAVKALDVGMRAERLIRGEPSERTAIDIEKTIRREYERWMTVGGGGDFADGDGFGDEDAGEDSR